MELSPDEILSEMLEGDSAVEDEFDNRPIIERIKASAGAPTPENEVKKGDTHTQWALGGNNKYIPVGSTAAKLPAGIYSPFIAGESYGLELMKVHSDTVYRLPDMATETILTEAETFWANEDKYRKHNLLYKRGLLLWGPPGGGKTVTVKLLMNELTGRDGVVVVVANVGLAIAALKALRRIEKDRNLIVVFEDIDEIIRYNGESAVLSMLDGEDNIDRVLHIATTNYPELLGARIVNRPSRFDRRIFVGMPGVDARREYLVRATNKGLKGKKLDEWVHDTDKMSIAHLRELVAAVYCLGQEYKEVIERLGAMQIKPKDSKENSGFKSGQLGFGAGSRLDKALEKAWQSAASGG